MIELTPLDVRKKQGDFARTFRGYDPQEVETFLEVVADRLEDLVRENLRLHERTERLEEQLSALEGRENAVHEALVTAQELRDEMSRQARREAELLRREAEVEVQKFLDEAERKLRARKERLEELERLRIRFLRSFRTLLERNLDAVDVEESRSPLEEIPLEIEFSVGEAKEEIRERVRSEGDEGVAGIEEAEAGVFGGLEDEGEISGEEERGEEGEEEVVVDVESLAPDGMSGAGPGEDEVGGRVERRGEGDEALWLPALEEEEEGR